MIANKLKNPRLTRFFLLDYHCLITFIWKFHFEIAKNIEYESRFIVKIFHYYWSNSQKIG